MDSGLVRFLLDFCECKGNWKGEGARVESTRGMTGMGLRYAPHATFMIEVLGCRGS